MTHLIQATDGSGVTEPLAVAGYEATRASRNAVHDTLDGGVGVAYGVARARSGTLTLVYESAADAWSAHSLLSLPCAFLLTSGVESIGMRFAVDGAIKITADDEVSDVWYVDVDFQEVPA